MSSTKIRRIIATLLAIGALISAAWTAADRRAALLDSIDIANDEAGAFYSLCNNGEDTYVQAVSADGMLIYSTKLPSDTRNAYYKYAYIDADKDSNCYVTIEEQNLKTGERRLYVQKLDSAGNKTEILFDGEYAVSGDISTYYMTDMSVIDDTVVLVQTDADYGSLLKSTYYISAKKYSSTLYEFQEDVEIREASASNTGDMFFTEKFGSLNRIEPSGDYEEIELNENIIPITLSVDENGSLYFTDGYGMAFYKYNTESKELSKIYDETSSVTNSNLFGELRSFRYSKGSFIGCSPHGSENNRFVTAGAETTLTIHSSVLPLSMLLLRFIQRFLLIASALLIIGAALYGFLYSRRLVFKLLIIMLPSVLIMLVTVYFSSKELLTETMLAEARNQLMTISSFLTGAISADDSEDISLHEQYLYADGPSASLLEKANTVPLIGERRIYGTIYRIIDGVSYIAADYPYNAIPKQVGVRESYYGGNPASGLIVTNDLFADGVKEGHVEIGMNPSYIEIQLNIQTWFLIVPICMFLFIIMSVFLMMIGRALKGLHKLNDAVTAMSNGDFDVRADIRTGDEYEDIGNAFNKMSHKISKYFNSLNMLNAAYERFIPNKIFKMLERDTILDVKLNDHKLTRIGFVSINVDNYFEVEKDKDAAEKFNLMTEIFSKIASTVNHTGGTIERFNNSGLTAIYDSVQDAVPASLGILDSLRSNDDTKEISLSITVQSCEAMIGIVGDSHRMTTAVFFDSAGLNDSLARFMKDFGISFIVTEDAYSEVSCSGRYTFRLAGALPAGGKTVKIYDVIESYSFGERQNRLITKQGFERAVNCFLAHDKNGARKEFISVLKTDPRDEAAKVYVLKCDEKGQEN